MLKINVSMLKLMRIHNVAVKECKLYVSKMMFRDDDEVETNISQLMFALQTNLSDQIINLLVSGATTQDIVDLVLLARLKSEDEQVSIPDEITPTPMTSNGSAKEEQQEKNIRDSKNFLKGRQLFLKFQNIFGKTRSDCEKEKEKATTMSLKTDRKLRRSSKIQRPFENL